MKCIVIATVLLACVATTLADITDDWKAALKECQTAEGASEEDMMPFSKHDKLSTYKSKCVLACTNDKLGYTTNGIVNADKVIQYAKEYLKDEKATKWSDATIACSDLKSADRCDRAEELVMCTINKLIGDGLDPMSFMV